MKSIITGYNRKIEVLFRLSIKFYLLILMEVFSTSLSVLLILYKS